jgi:hypothetical protein
MPEAVIGRGVDGRQDNRVLRTDAFRDGHPDHLIYVSVFDDEIWFAVVGAEHASVGAMALDQREQVASCGQSTPRAA